MLYLYNTIQLHIGLKVATFTLKLLLFLVAVVGGGYLRMLVIGALLVLLALF